jgi:hypothetical protein
MGGTLKGVGLAFDSDGRCAREGRISHMNQKARRAVYGCISLQLASSRAVKFNANEAVLVFYNTLDCINPLAMEKRNLETVKAKLPDLLYLTIVHAFVFTANIISIKIHHYSDVFFLSCCSV